MIESEDLRIGNIVLDEDGEQQVILGFTWNFVHFKSGLYDPYDRIYGVPITPELLLKAGFESDDEKSNIYFIQVGNLLYLEYDVKFKSFSITPETWRGGSACDIWKNITFLHELQNLFYFLSNEDLKITPNERKKAKR